MDPKSNLREQLELAQDIIRITDRECSDSGELTSGQYQEVRDLAMRLADLVEALHEWNR